jgi:hypothetical protein
MNGWMTLAQGCMELDESRFAIFELDEKQSEKELLQQGFDGGNELRNVFK